MKKIAIIVLLFVIAAALVYALAGGRDAAVPAQTEGEGQAASGDREVRGSIVLVNTDQVPADGPSLVIVKKEDGTEAVVAIRSMGINLCPAQKNIADPYKLKAGDAIEAKGSLSEDGMIVPCESESHYLRVSAR